jgi:D-arabinose 1-dehydrogenase-like Zn-dependent alcohol dehydrogenase
MASPDYTFEGWVAHDPSSVAGNMQWTTYEPKPFEPTDVDIAITHCGICGSDLHHLRSGWRPADYPMVVGHEIVGHVIRVGAAVPSDGPNAVRLGDRVGVGAMCKSCLRADCVRCARDQEQHCANEWVGTYDSRYANGEKAYGGYARYWRGPAAFVFRLPGALASEVAAPLLCAGVTVYTPLVENGAGPGKRVGVVGMGGLGHLAVAFAKSLRSEKVVAISRSSGKAEDARRLGADEFIATAEEADWTKKHADSLDLIISTVSGSGFELEKYLALLDVNGTLIQVGAPEDPIPSFSAFALLRKSLKIGGSLIGSRKMMREMLEHAAKAQVRPWVEVRPMGQANQAVVDMEKGKARYRYVLANHL